MNSSTAPTVARPLGSYTLTKRAGDFIFVSGTTARQADGSVAGVTVRSDGTRLPDVAVQTRAVIDKIRRLLAEHGAGLADCVEVVVFLVDVADFEAFNKAYGEAFAGPEVPTRTTVAVRALPHPDVVVEMKVVAYKPARDRVPPVRA